LNLTTTAYKRIVLATKGLAKPVARFVALLFILLLINHLNNFGHKVFAAINEALVYQGKIVNPDGTNLTSSDAACINTSGADTCDFRVSIYTSSSGGTLVWQETKSDVELDDFGDVFTLELDCGGTFSSCNQNGGPDFTSGSLFIEVEFDPSGNGDFSEGETFSPRKTLAAVPYAFNAKTADQLGSFAGSDFLRSNANDTYESGNTLTIAGDLNVDGALNIASTSVTLDGASTTFTQTTGAITFNPAGGSNFNIGLSGTGDFTVNTNDLYVDSSTHRVGIGTATPGGTLELASGQLLLPDGTAAAPSLSFGNATGIGMRQSGSAIFFSKSGADLLGINNATAALAIQAGYALGFNSTTGPSAFLLSDGANNISLRNSTNAQSFRIYNTYSSGTSYERGDFYWSSNVLSVGTSKGSGGGSARSLALLTDGTQRLFIDTAGLVGISTNTPSAGLDISNGSVSLLLGADNLYTTRTDATSKNARLGIAHYNNAEEPFAIFNAGSGTSTNVINFGGGTSLLNAATDIIFTTAANNTTTSGTQRMVINSSGNVGIGTASPGQLLDVAGDIELANYLYFGNGATEYLRWNGSDLIASDDFLPAADGVSSLGSSSSRWTELFVKGSSIHIGDTGNEAILGYNTTSNYLGFDPDGDTTSEVVILDNGNVGIGTTSPSYPLEIAGDNGGTVRFFFDTVNGKATSIVRDSSTSTFRATRTELGLDAWRNDADSYIRVLNSGGYLANMTITGKVGIGDTSPASALTVGNGDLFQVNSSGQIIAAAGITSSGTITFSGLSDGVVTSSSGVLSGGTIGATAITADSLDFTEFKDAMALDASTDIAVDGSEEFSITNTGTGNSFRVNDVGSDTTPFIIDASGNIGIGTTSATHALEIANHTTATGGIALGSDTFLYRNGTGQLTLEATYTNINSTYFTVSGAVSTFGTASIDAGTQVKIESPTSARKGLLVKGASGQSVNLQEWQNNGGTVLASISKDGAGLFTKTLAVQNSSAVNYFSVDSDTGISTFRGKSAITAPGSEMVTNGDFATSSDWTYGTNWAWNASGYATHTAGATADLSQAISFSNGSVYVVQFQIKNMTAGTVRVKVNGAQSPNLTTYDSNNNFAPVITAGASGGLVFTPSSDFDGSIDNVSVKLVTKNSAAVVLLDDTGTIVNEQRSLNGAFAFGTNALQYLGLASSGNVALGDSALRSAVSTSRNVAIGSGSLASMSYAGTGYNVAIGGASLYANETGVQNVAIGYGTLQKAKYSINNVAIGHSALYNLDGRNPDGNAGGNTAIGAATLSNLTVGYNNTAIGMNAMLYSTTAIANVAIGNGALQNNISGSSNNVIGTSNFTANTSGGSNVGVGSYVFLGNTTESGNTSIGAMSGSRIGGTRNAFLGYMAGYANFTVRTGLDYNTIVGSRAGYSLNGSSNVFLGYEAGYNEGGSNTLYIANSSTTTPLIYGLFSGAGAGLTIHSQNSAGVPLTVKGITSQSSNLQEWKDTGGTVLSAVAANGRIGAGTSAPDYALDVAGDIGLDQYIYHNGDANTYLSFTDDQLDVVAGGAAFLRLSEGTSDIMYVNPAATDIDFNIRGSSNSALFYVNAGTDRVGIGTTTPGSELHVVGNLELEDSYGKSTSLYTESFGSGDGYLRLDAGGTSGKSFVVRDIYDEVFHVGVSNGYSYFRDFLDVGDIVYAGGGFHIGNAVDANLLDDSSNGSGSTTMYIGNASINVTASDRRLKDNIETSNLNALELINRFEVVDFDWKEGTKWADRGRATGLIAQDVYEYLPQVVDKPDDPANTWSIEYHHLVPYLIKGIQEQEQKIEDLQEQLAQLEVDTETQTNLTQTNTIEVTPEDTTYIDSKIQELKDTYESFKGFAEALGLTTQTQDSTTTMTLDANFLVTGDTTLGGLTITKDLQVGSIRLESLTNELSVIGPSCYTKATGSLNEELCELQTIYFQKNLSGNIDFMDGAILFEADGTVRIEGEVEAKTITAQDYKYLSNSETIGQSAIKSGESSVTVEVRGISKDAIVFITPTTDTKGQQLYVSKITESESFKVSISKTIDEDSSFNWWVLKSE